MGRLTLLAGHINPDIILLLMDMADDLLLFIINI